MSTTNLKPPPNTPDSSASDFRTTTNSWMKGTGVQREASMRNIANPKEGEDASRPGTTGGRVDNNSGGLSKSAESPNTTQRSSVTEESSVYPKTSVGPSASKDRFGKSKSLNSLLAGISDDLYGVLSSALEGTVNSEDFRGASEFITQSNLTCLSSCQATVSKTTLEFQHEGNPVPVVSRESTDGWQSDSIKIDHFGKKKIYFEMKYVTNPKFELQISPMKGDLGKGESVEIKFNLRAFCTTKVYQLVCIDFSAEEGGGFLSEKKYTKLGTYFLSFRVDSDLSTFLDFDEITFGDHIASGGYGTVFKGVWRDSEVAVKVLNTDGLQEDEMQSVLREIRLMKKLSHPHIVTYMGSTQVPGQPLCIIMEFIKGGVLTKLLEATTLGTRFKSKLCIDVAKGLAFLHQNNIFHRDIKPDNALLISPHPDADVNVKITDFGTSKSALKPKNPSQMNLPINLKNNAHIKIPKVLNPPVKSNLERRQTKGVGTLVYCAPEILSGKQDYSIDKCDVFSFGMLMWQVYTQKEPFGDPPYDEWKRWDIEKFVISGKRLPIPSIVPPRVALLIEQCIDQDPTKRPNLTSIKRELTEIYNSLPPDDPADTGKLIPTSSFSEPNANNNSVHASGTSTPNSSHSRNSPYPIRCHQCEPSYLSSFIR